MKRHPSKKRMSGFALIATLMMLILLLLLAVGIQSVSAISLRSAKQSDALMEARANAKLALMIAIGELQKQMGPDQRVSANGDILDADSSNVKNKHWLGVWNSWKAGTGEASQHSTIQGVSDEMSPSYEPNRQDYFRSWLVSLNPSEANQITSAKDLDLIGVKYPSLSDTAIQLVAEGSLGSGGLPVDYVSARLVNIMDKDEVERVKGRYGWWVGDESQKARVMHDSYDKISSPTDAQRIYRSQAPGSTGTKTIKGLEELTVDQDLKLEALPSMKTLDLVPEDESKEPAKKNFHFITPFSRSVLADVREGGLKRDLSILLERSINPNERTDEFMLYKFNTKDSWANLPTLPNTPQECVPIQDLAAFYQLYDNDPGFTRGRRGGVQYTSGPLANAIQVNTPDFGTTANYTTRFQREYTTLYRNPVPIKVQFLLSFVTENITATDRSHPNNVNIPPTDTLKLRIAAFPAVTMWNPYNVPIIMQSGTAGALSQQLSLKPPAFAIRCQKRRSNGTTYNAKSLNMGYAGVGGSVSDGRAERRNELMRMNFARTSPIRFEPGEVKVFSMPNNTTGAVYVSADPMNNALNMPKNLVDGSAGWNPSGYFTFRNSTVSPGPIATPNVHHSNVVFESNNRYSLALNPSDEITLTIITESNVNAGENVSQSVSPIGSALCFYLAQRNYSAGGYGYMNMRHFSMVSRFGGGVGVGSTSTPQAFNRALLAKGMPGGTNQFSLEPITASNIASATAGGESYPFMQMAIMAGCETGELSNGGLAAGRKFPSRPFLHSSPLQSNVIDQNDSISPYNHGWNWWIEDMNSILEALVQESASGGGYYGGGFTPESGVTRVVQQQIPVVPPISIAALSHARLGGFTLASEAPAGQGVTGTGQAEGYGPNTGWIDNPSNQLGFQRVTATGQAGLYPHVLQAIGNSYANPVLAADLAYNSSWQRLYDQDQGARSVTFADHSYLANKSLWDEFFFSSITPERSQVEVFGGSNKTVSDITTEFFLSDSSTPLLNRRMTPYKSGLDETKLNALLAEILTYNNGMGDKIASYLMVDGAFNVNSTSVEAWKILFSSLRGKPVAYLQSGKVPSESIQADKTPAASGMLPNAAPIESADITSPSQPAEQWMTGRSLTDDEIDELAVAMVKQVKQRGPFLSMSDFVNRRLEGRNSPEEIERSVKGALQAALDDEEVSINANFRESGRMLDSEVTGIPFAFPEAAKGPIAYGSMAYVDQADVLSGLAEQLTPRGDTFVIRTYGDTLDSKGKIVARAWCEAVVQRLPEYVNSDDESHLKQADPSLSEDSKRFGRKMQVISFRWLNPSEI